MIAKQVKLSLLATDAGTQQRPIENDIVTEYLELMQDGAEFPPVEVISDKTSWWLVDGFHRVECAKRFKQKTVRAYITIGTLRDAIWQSFAANRDHGMPRGRETKKDIIVKILTDKTWAKKSLTAIGKHVGVTKQYVSKIKMEIADSAPKTDSMGKPSLPMREGEIEVERGGKKYTQKSQEKGHKQPASKAKPKAKPKSQIPTDSVGVPIPDKLQKVYADRANILDAIRAASTLAKDVIGRVDARDPAWSLLNITAFQANCKNLVRTLKSAVPYAVCCYCGGDPKDCKACQGFGFLNRDNYNAAPKELKQ